MLSPAHTKLVNEVLAGVVEGHVLDGVPFVDYVTIPALNWSTLKVMAKSALHYKHALHAPRDDNARLLRGRAVHTAVLEPDRFALEYAVFDGSARRGKAWHAFAEVNSARTILKASEYEHCLRIRDAVRAHPLARELLAGAQMERTVLWVDKATGFPCKGRIDLTNDDVVCDLKTTGDLDMRRFGGIAARLGYHCQLAWYQRGLDAVGLSIGTFNATKMIVVEADAPHDVAVFGVDTDLIFAGDEECTELVTRVRECTASGEWRGRYAAEEPLQLPAWWYAQDGEAELAGVTRAPSDDDAHNIIGSGG